MVDDEIRPGWSCMDYGGEKLAKLVPVANACAGHWVYELYLDRYKGYDK